MTRSGLACSQADYLAPVVQAEGRVWRKYVRLNAQVRVCALESDELTKYRNKAKQAQLINLCG